MGGAGALTPRRASGSRPGRRRFLKPQMPCLHRIEAVNDSFECAGARQTVLRSTGGLPYRSRGQVDGVRQQCSSPTPGMTGCEVGGPGVPTNRPGFCVPRLKQPRWLLRWPPMGKRSTSPTMSPPPRLSTSPTGRVGSWRRIDPDQTSSSRCCSSPATPARSRSVVSCLWRSETRPANVYSRDPQPEGRRPQGWLKFGGGSKRPGEGSCCRSPAHHVGQKRCVGQVDGGQQRLCQRRPGPIGWLEGCGWDRPIRLFLGVDRLEYPERLWGLSRRRTCNVIDAKTRKSGW